MGFRVFMITDSVDAQVSTPRLGPESGGAASTKPQFAVAVVYKINLV